MMLSDLGRNVTYSVSLPGGQRRLKEAALYVMHKAVDFDYFGLVKLNKILWRADFEAFYERHQPVTGRQYQVLKNGPAPYEMLPVLNDLVRGGAIEIQETAVPNEQRPVAKVDPVLTFFSAQDLRYLDESIAHFRAKQPRRLVTSHMGWRGARMAWATLSRMKPPYLTTPLLRNACLCGWRTTSIRLPANWTCTAPSALDRPEH